MGPAQRGSGAEAEERFPNLGKLPLHQGNRLGQKGSIWGCWKRVKAADLWQRGQSEKYTDSPYLGLTCPRVRRVFTGVWGGWELECRDWRTGSGQELLLDVGRWTEGMGRKKSTAGNAYREHWAAMESGCYCWVTRRERSYYWNLSLSHTPVVSAEKLKKPSELALMCQLQGIKKKKKKPLRTGPHAPAARHQKKPGQGWPSCVLCQAPEKILTKAISVVHVATGFPACLALPGILWSKQSYNHCALYSPGQTQELQGNLGTRLLWVDHMQRWR